MSLSTRTKKLWKKLVKDGRLGRRSRPDRLAHSLMDGRYCERCIADRDGVTYYGFLSGDDFTFYYDVDTVDDLTDEEIDEWFEENMKVRICSPFDCTGKLFTWVIDWHRNPCGAISYVHKMVYDW